MFFLWKFLDYRASSGGNVTCGNAICGKSTSVAAENDDVLDTEDDDVRDERQRVMTLDDSGPENQVSSRDLR